MKKKKNVKFIVLLCANIASLIACYFWWIYHISDWLALLELQSKFTLSCVAIYYFIELVNAVKKIANQKDLSNCPLADSEKKAN